MHVTRNHAMNIRSFRRLDFQQKGYVPEDGLCLHGSTCTVSYYSAFKLHKEREITVYYSMFFKISQVLQIQDTPCEETCLSFSSLPCLVYVGLSPALHQPVPTRALIASRACFLFVTFPISYYLFCSTVTQFLQTCSCNVLPVELVGTITFSIHLHSTKKCFKICAVSGSKIHL